MRMIVDNSHLVDENMLAELADIIRTSKSYAWYTEDARNAISKALILLTAEEDWEGIIRLRRLFSFLGRGETLGLGPILSYLNQQAVVAALKIAENFSAGQ